MLYSGLEQLQHRFREILERGTDNNRRQNW